MGGISKKIRFEVFKRDGFHCAYCGKSPPSVVLEVDHIDPRSKGGEDGLHNLITACFDCNRGKKDIPLSKIPAKLSDTLSVLKEQEDQLREYRKFVKQIEKRITKDIDEIDNIYQAQYSKWRFSDSFRQISVKKFLQQLPKHEVADALHIAISRFSTDRDKAIRYFCGICWNRIRAATDPQYTTKRDLEQFWKSRPRGSGYLPQGIIERWLLNYTPQQIKDAMAEANGIWSLLKDLLGV